MKKFTIGHLLVVILLSMNLGASLILMKFNSLTSIPEDKIERNTWVERCAKKSEYTRGPESYILSNVPYHQRYQECLETWDKAH